MSVVKSMAGGAKRQRHTISYRQFDMLRTRGAFGSRLRRQPNRKQRYDATHRRLRREWLPFVQAGSVVCGRSFTGECLHPEPRIAGGESWDLDHLANGARHPSHADCNRAARVNPRSKS